MSEIEKADVQNAITLRKAPGRPSAYGPEIVHAICLQIMEGKGLPEICRAHGMPHRATVHRWLVEHEDFRRQYELARLVQADHFADEILEIADDSRNDWLEREEGGSTLNAEHIQRAKVRIETRKWLMAKMAPRKYGDRVEHAVGGDPNAPPVKSEIVVSFVRPAE